MNLADMTSVTIYEVSYVYSLLPTWFVLLLLATYIGIGGLYWSRLMLKWELEEGLEDHLVCAEKVGTHSRSETVALMVVKATFTLLWPLYIALILVCMTVGWLRPKPVTC